MSHSPLFDHFTIALSLTAIVLVVLAVVSYMGDRKDGGSED